MKKPILSILLLSCGHEPHIEECLKGVAALRERMAAEIIVVDTSPEKSGEARRIIEEYADEVVDFDWNDDFAAARNAGLGRCRGCWFMYVDDDEVLEDAEAVTAFFRSGEYKKYKSAAIVIRNLGDEAGERYFDNWVPRLHERPKGAHFESRVHEHFVPAEYPMKALQAVARHYGYIFRTREELMEHSGRNLRLVEKELAEHPDDIHMRIHYLQEYVRRREFDRQREVAEDCLKWLEGKDDRQSLIYRGVCEGLLLRADRMQGRFTEGKERLLGLREDESYLPVARAYFAQEGARIYDGLDDLAGSRREAEEYLAIYDSIQDELEEHADELAFYLASTFDEENLGDMRGIVDGVRPPERLGMQTILTEDDEEYITSLPLSEWIEKTDRFMEHASAGEIAAKYNEIKSRQEHPGIRHDYFYMRTDEKMLMAWVRAYDGILPEGREDVEKAYRLFCDRLAGFCEKTPVFYEDYKGQLDDGERKRMEPRLSLARKLSEILPTDQMDAGEILRAVRDMLGVYPDFDPVLTYFAHLYGAYMKQGGLEKGKPPLGKEEVAEMRRIIDSLQQKVQDLVSAGMVEEADKLLQEIQKYTAMLQ